MHITPRKPNRIMVAINERNRSCHDYYVIDIRNGRRSLYFENTECFIGALFDDSFALRVLAKENAVGGVDYFKVDRDEANVTEKLKSDAAKSGYHIVQIHLLRSVPPDETSSTTPLQVDSSGTTLFWLDASESDKGILTAEDLATGVRKVLYEPVSSELVECTFHPASGRPLFVYESYLKPRQAMVPPGESAEEKEEYRAAAAAWRHLRASLPANTEPFIISASQDFSVWLVVTQTDNAPGAYWIYRAPTLTYLFSRNERLTRYVSQKLSGVSDSGSGALFRYELAHRRAIEVPTDDGWTELCYLTLPAESVRNPNRSFRPDHPLPMVMFVHGGPWARDRWGFSNEMEFLANRGYAVLQCNFRGSVGFGKTYANAGDGQWGLRMQKDLTDAVRWAIKEKIALEDKVAIAGYSYGGYAALAGLTTTPDLYACAVDAVGPSNLLTLMRTLPPYWTPAFNMFKRRLGADPLTEAGRKKLKEASPFFHADKIRRPLLVAHGVQDPRVKLEESDMIVRAAKANNVSVTYVTFQDEGHGFRRPENNMAFWALTERFLQSCLGGKAEPILDAVQKSTAHFVSDMIS